MVESFIYFFYFLFTWRAHQPANEEMCLHNSMYLIYHKLVVHNISEYFHTKRNLNQNVSPPWIENVGSFLLTFREFSSGLWDHVIIALGFRLFRSFQSLWKFHWTWKNLWTSITTFGRFHGTVLQEILTPCHSNKSSRSFWQSVTYLNSQKLPWNFPLELDCLVEWEMIIDIWS